MAGTLSTELRELMESKDIFNWVHIWQASYKIHHLYLLFTTHNDFDSDFEGTTH